VRVEVLARDVIWAQDGWRLGRLPDGRALESQLFKDRGSLRTLGWDVGVAQSQGDLIAQLEWLRTTRGLPLVVSSDNLSSCCGRLVEAYLAFYRVVHLLSLPHTPEHNGAAECHIHELRGVTGFRKGVVHADAWELMGRLVRAAIQAPRGLPKTGIPSRRGSRPPCSGQVRCDHRLAPAPDLPQPDVRHQGVAQAFSPHRVLHVATLVHVRLDRLGWARSADSVVWKIETRSSIVSVLWEFPR
jgi:hypothetical protein